MLKSFPAVDQRANDLAADSITSVSAQATSTTPPSTYTLLHYSTSAGSLVLPVPVLLEVLDKLPISPLHRISAGALGRFPRMTALESIAEHSRKWWRERRRRK